MNQQVFFIGCLHFGDTKLVNVFDGIRTRHSDAHDEEIIRAWNEVVSCHDTVYILGDVTNEDSSEYYKLSALNGKKIVVMGNHDKPEHAIDLLQHVQGICGMKYLEVDGYKLWLTHAPLHPQELMHVDFNIHAHIHHMSVPYTEVRAHYWNKSAVIKSKSKLGYINVDAKEINYQPRTLQQLLESNQQVYINNF